MLSLTLTGCSSGSTSEAAPASSGTASATTDSRDLATSSATQQSCVQQAVSSMNVAEQAGQLIMIGTPLTDADSVTATMKRNHIGSVFLHGRSSRTAAGLKKEIKRLPSMTAGTATITPLVSIDQEGGQVQSLRGGTWGYVADADEQGTWTSSRLATVTGQWAKSLARAGITMDLAPVADTVPSGTEKNNPPIGVFSRQFGSRPADVATAITTVTTAMKDAGVIATVKHFPGLGRVTKNTDTSAGVVDNRTTTNDAYLKPFQAGIDAGAGAVMISSATYKKIDPDNRAVFSSTVITDLLRGQMGYQGVVMTDDIGAAAAVSDVPVGQRAVRFVRAGGDLVLTIEASQARTMMTALSSKAKKDAEFAAQVEAATTRVLTLKEEAGLLTCE